MTKLVSVGNGEPQTKSAAAPVQLGYIYVPPSRSSRLAPVSCLCELPMESNDTQTGLRCLCSIEQNIFVIDYASAMDTFVGCR